MKKILTLLYIIFLCFVAVARDEALPAIDFSSSMANNDTLLVMEDQTALMDILANDSAGASSVSFESLITLPTHGTASFNDTTQLLEYSPKPNFYHYFESPVDSIQYKVTKAGSPSESDSAWVMIFVTAVNEQPIANDDSFRVQQDSGAIYAPVLMNDYDIDRAGLKVSLLSSPLHGELSIPDWTFVYYTTDTIFMNDNGITSFNTNLLIPYDERDTSYMFDTVYVYQPDSGFYGYDSIQYKIEEYYPSDVPFVLEECYASVNAEDADTATVYFYVNPHDYLPVASNDTIYNNSALYPLPASGLRESDVDQSITFSPLVNDLDADTLPALPGTQLEIIFLGKEKDSNAHQDTLYFEHDIPTYDENTQSLVYKKDSNIVIFDSNTKENISYSYAAGFSGVDSLFYQVLEKPLAPDSDYPAAYRGDTSDFGIIYFVVEPLDDPCIPVTDTLDFDLSQIENPSQKLWQYFDVLSNDVELDSIDEGTLDAFERLMGDDFNSEMADYGNKAIKTLAPGYGQGVHSLNYSDTKQYFTLEEGDSMYYWFTPPYAQNFIIDSIGYYIYSNSLIPDTAGWAYIRNTPPVANNDTLWVDDQFIISLTDSTIANNFDLISNDVDADNDTLQILFNGSNLKSPKKSAYAVIKDAGNGNINYYYHQGFTEKDSFQYIVSDLLCYDTAWVFINNDPVIAQTDTFILPGNPFVDIPAESEIIDILFNDLDNENNVYLLALENGLDSLETSYGSITVLRDSFYQEVEYAFKDTFFYKDSFRYVVTDAPAYFAAENFFSHDTAWVYVIDADSWADSDGDGLVNTMENLISGYQEGEDSVGIGENGIPNYLNWDADNDGFPDGGDCDNDGIPNIMDSEDCGGNSLGVSNLFSPNGDGVNDYFIIPTLYLGNGQLIPASIKIYNRWGSLVYQNDHYGQDNDWWDGTIGDVQGLSIGDELPDGVYLYYLNYSGNEKQGYIHIQR